MNGDTYKYVFQKNSEKYLVKLDDTISELKSILFKKGGEYGDTYSIVFELLKQLFSDKKDINGNFILSENDLKSLLAIIRILDKLCRYVHGHEEDVWEDIAGYAILEITKTKHKI